MINFSPQAFNEVSKHQVLFYVNHGKGLILTYGSCSAECCDNP